MMLIETWINEVNMDSVLNMLIQVVQGLLMAGLLYYLSTIKETLTDLVTQQKVLSEKLPYMLKEAVDEVTAGELRELSIRLSKNNEMLRDLKVAATQKGGS